ncbi:Lrp/AsnC family transcriptional regulator [Pokkaliibacter sp. CJK22405]|uniref:Lrp/AsnC family transcriptional regulator n=1 Tax=Pokkaliibacter sp. CJK22405 TaxID=3384615 RepID=UPI003984D547
MADAFDLKILAKLQENSVLSPEVISESAGLSSASCYRRIKKLESEGYIKARRTVLDEKKLGFQVTAMFMIKLAQDSMDIDKRMKKICDSHPEIVQCYLVSNDYDFVMIGKFREAQDYTEYLYNFLQIFADIPILNYSSSLVVKTICDHNLLPL